MKTIIVHETEVYTCDICDDIIDKPDPEHVCNICRRMMCNDCRTQIFTGTKEWQFCCSICDRIGSIYRDRHKANTAFYANKEGSIRMSINECWRDASLGKDR